MGEAATRITAADFLTPPELAGRTWRTDAAPRAESDAGRVGGVRLELGAGPAGTQLGRCYQQVPLRLLPPFPFGDGQPSLLYRLCNEIAGV
jgi:urease accessory protein